jgi:hypothetical protein
VLADSATMSRIATIREARQGVINEDLNQPGSLVFRVPIADEVGAKIKTVNTCVLVLKNKKRVWSGFVLTIKREAEGDAGWMTVGCVGWFERLFRRLIHPDQEETITGEAHVHAHRLLSKANARGATLPGAPSSTNILPGLGESNGIALTRTYEQMQKVGDQIQQLTQIESGVDISVDPSTRLLHVYAKRESFRPNIKLRLRGRVPTLRSATQDEDASRFANQWWVLGANSQIGHAKDDQSETEYGLFEDQASLSDVADAQILGAYANAQLAVNAHPSIVYSISPRSMVSMAGFSLYEDILLGDSFTFTVERGSFQVPGQRVRLFGFSVGIDGEETVNSLKLEAA